MPPQITMGTFIVSFIGNGFVRSAQSWLPGQSRFSPQVRQPACLPCTRLHRLNSLPCSSARPPPVTAPLLAACLQARRRLLVIAYYMAIVSLLTLFGVLIVPDVVREGADFVSRLQTENLWVVVLEKMRKGLG